MKKLLYLILTITILSSVNSFAEKKPFTFEDAMKFKSIRGQEISDNGEWLSFEARPDRGDSEVKIISTKDTSTNYTLERGNNPTFSKNSNWLAAYRKPPAIELENAKKDKPKNGMYLFKLSTGTKYEFDKVNKFNFSNDSKWIAFELDEKSGDDKKDDNEKEKITGNTVILRHLQSGTDIAIKDVNEFMFDSTSIGFFYAVSSYDEKRDGVYFRDLNEPFAPEKVIRKKEQHYYANLEWNEQEEILAFTESILDDKGKPEKSNLDIWKFSSPNLIREVLTTEMVPEDWFIPHKNDLDWTDDGKRLFFGMKPWSDVDTTDSEDVKYDEENFYSEETILEEKTIKVWHWDDDRISSNQVIWWGQNKDRTFKAVFHLDENTYKQLGSLELPNVQVAHNPKFTVAYDDTPYLKEITWNGWFQDIYLVDLKTSAKYLIAEKVQEPAYISPNGNYVAYFHDSTWYSYDTKLKKSIDLTTKIKSTVFYDTEHDQPIEARSSGFAGWLDTDRGFLVYDARDIWFLRTDVPEQFISITGLDGKFNDIQFRLRKLDPDKKVWNSKDTVYMTGFNKSKKYQNLYYQRLDEVSPARLTNTDNELISFEGKAKSGKQFIFSKQRYDVFPDLWWAEGVFDTTMQISNVNPQMDEFIWGTTEIVEWVTPVGDSLQGFLIKPDNFDPNKKYPMLVYFYEQFSDYTHRFFQPALNHRPCYPVYLGEGYLIFHPDIKYYAGNPGFDAKNSLVSGVEELISRGYVDTEKIALQGHSWAAYQAAHIISQTDLFAASCVGAPVGNMTSAYSGIRLGTGLARQFQYEKWQSRIGGTLWDSLDNYLNNSPVMKAETINTPLLIMHGDVDEAVPWEQGVELYLALRRLEKNCILIQYEGEKHHPRKYANKLDWATKMKEFFDYYIMGKPPKKWITEGDPYFGKD